MEEKKYSLLDSNSDDIRSGRLTVRKPEKKTGNDEKKKKRRIYFITVIAVSVLLACAILPRLLLSVNESLVYELKINETDITDYPDGTYTGTYSTGHMSATVNVTVVSGRMTAIVLSSFTGISNSRANEVLERVVYYQMLNIPEGDSADVFSQPTDFVVLKAVETALSGRNYTAGVSV